MTEAILLVGGAGTRLRPLTESTAKPMLPVAGVPFIGHQLAMAAAAGVDHVVLATSYKAETFTAQLGEHAYGVDLSYSVEVEPLGTGGAIRHASSELRGGAEDSVLIYNGDILSGHDLHAQLAAHHHRGADVTLHLTEVEDPRAFGCVPTTVDGRVTAFLEKTSQPVTNLINAGCYVFRREVIDAIPTGRPVSAERETFPGLLEAGAFVLGHIEQAYWLDLGTPAALVQASADLVRGVVISPALGGGHGEAMIDPSAQVAEGAVVTGGSSIGAACSVAPDAVVDGCLLRNGVDIGAGARLTRCVLGLGARVGAGCVLSDVVVGDGADVGAGVELAGGARVWSGIVLPDGAIRFA